MAARARRPERTSRRIPERFAAHWVSPHGGLRLFLGIADTREDAEEVARRNLAPLGVGTGDTIRVTPVAWRRPRDEDTRRAG
jgi:hypothetical protein